METPIQDKPGQKAKYFTCLYDKPEGLGVTLILHQEKNPKSPNSQEMLINTFISDVFVLFSSKFFICIVSFF